MMKNADTPAMPTKEAMDENVTERLRATGMIVPTIKHHHGLTKREHFAGLAMQGLLASGSGASQYTARDAIEIANYILKELAKGST